MPDSRDYQLPGRSPVYAANGMAATAHPEATATAIETLKAGGNAFDAAIAAAGVLAVVEPGMSGIGGDCFALLSTGGETNMAYNGTGTAGRSMTADRLLELGVDTIRPDSPHSVTTPGAVDAWQAILDTYGTRDFGELLAPAIKFAEQGYIVQPRVAFEWQLGLERIKRHPSARSLFLNHGQPLVAGDVHRQPKLAKALRAIASRGADGFYKGPVAQDIVASLRAAGGLQALEDFAAVGGSWVDPVASDYRGFEVMQCPPNGQGFMVSIMLNILTHFSVDELKPDSAENLHLQIEVSRLAYADRNRFFDDYYATERATEALTELLSAEHARAHARRIHPERAMDPEADQQAIRGGDTTYIAVADRDGNAISLMNSLYHPFGSGLASEQYGILLHNRGSAFVVSGPAPRVIEPGKRPVHTILPAMLAKHGRPTLIFGVVGAEFQSGGQVRVVSGVVDAGLNVQQALDLPRVFYGDDAVLIERGLSDPVRQQLESLGHRMKAACGPLGAGQAIWIDHERGCLIGGTDHRKDGCAIGY